MAVALRLPAVWSRRWFRRTTYTLVAGAALLGGIAWSVQRPFFRRWVAARLDRVLREETGLGLEVDDLELHFFQGRVVARRPRLGGDFFQAEQLEAVVDTSDLLVGKLRIRMVDLDRPQLRLDAQRLGALRLKAHPPRTSKARWEVDRLSVREGRILVQEPAWGIPDVSASFSVHGEGQGTNRLKLFLDVPSLRVGGGASALGGHLACQADLQDTVVSLSRGELAVGRSHLRLTGRYETETDKLGSAFRGSLDLASLQAVLAPDRPSLSGTLAFRGETWGLATAPSWKLSVNGRELASAAGRLRPGTLLLDASGTPATAAIQHLAWTSPDGQLVAQGTWQKGEGSHLRIQGREVGLAPAAALARAEFLKDATAQVDGEAFLPGDPWKRPPLDRLKADLRLRFSREGAPAGGVRLAVAEGRFAADALEIRLPTFTFQGQGKGILGPKGLQEISGEGTTDTDAAVVAAVLAAWRIGDKERVPVPGRSQKPKIIVHPFKMAGRTQAQAQVHWTRATGITLHGTCEVEGARWHGAQADHLSATARIQDQQLWLSDIGLSKGEGRGWGELWLAFDPRPPGQDEIDMCYRAVHLPVEEGLRAADLDPKEIQVSGSGSGWVRIHGPYDAIRLEGGAQAEEASVYGMRIPALSGDFTLDVEGERIQVRDLRIGESLASLGEGEDAPSGLLSLQGAMDMDYGRHTWQAFLRGDLDSDRLGLGGPRFQARVEASLAGPWTQPVGSTQLPLGRVSFRGGRVFLGDQSLEGLEGAFESEDGHLNLQVGMAGKSRPLVAAEGWSTPRGFVGALDLQVGPETADTAHLATRLSRDLLQDLRAEASAEGLWNAEGLHWTGRLNQLVGSFANFELHQERPTSLRGDASGAVVDLRLEGRSGDSSLASIQAKGRVPFSPRSPLGLRLQGSAELAKLKPIADHLMDLDSYSLLGDLDLRGSASFDLALGGPYREPTLDGTLNLMGGSMVVRGYPQGVEDLDFTLRFQGRDVILPKDDPARGLLAQGALAFWGKATWGFGGFTAYDLEAQLEEFEFRDIPEGFELQGDLQANLKGDDRSGGVLKGTMQANRMLYRADINLRDLILSSALGGSAAASGLDPDDPLGRIGLDLDLQLPGEPWTFDTNLLKLQGRPPAGSAFRVKGTLARPALQGKMEFIPGGRVTNLLPAGDIVVERGSIGFSELAQGAGPQLDILGRVDVPPYVVNLQIRGGLDALEMSPTSTPALRRDEITAILIDPSLAPTIGSTTSASSTLSYGLAKTSSGLLTSLALADFQERVRRAFNLDRVNVAWRPGTAGNSESTVIVGKTFKVADWQLPVIFTRTKVGEVTTLSGKGEWRLGNLVLQLGASQSGSTGLNPSFEIRHTWSPK